MAYNRETLEQILNRIPTGQVTRHGLLAKALGTTARAVAPAICRFTGPGRLRVVMKGGWFPHPDDKDDCRERARFLNAEGLHISDDGLRVLVNEEQMWRPQ